jgi:hypothetical protein
MVTSTLQLTRSSNRPSFLPLHQRASPVVRRCPTTTRSTFSSFAKRGICSSGSPTAKCTLARIPRAASFCRPSSSKLFADSLTRSRGTAEMISAPCTHEELFRTESRWTSALIPRPGKHRRPTRVVLRGCRRNREECDEKLACHFPSRSLVQSCADPLTCSLGYYGYVVARSSHHRFIIYHHVTYVTR